MEAAANQQTTDTQLNTQVILTRLRDQLTLFQAQWHTLPATLKTVWGRVGAQIRDALDVPSREELETLTARLEASEARLAALSANGKPHVELVPPVTAEEEVAKSAELPEPVKNGDEKRRRQRH